MSERIEGFSIGLDLDTIKVTTGLKDLKAKLSLANSELRNNLSVFDRSDKSIGKYETRLQGLNKRLEVQSAITDKARQSYEKMVSEYGEGSAEADKAARSYNEQSTRLNAMKRDVESVTAELAQLREEQRLANSSLFKFGDGLTNFGNQMKSVSAKTKDLGKSLTKKITMPAVGAAAALGGIALAKGFGRLVGIDNAKAKLKGLGHDAKNIGKIMDSALESVKGTSYGMDQAVTTAANAVAAGVKEGKELTRYLSLTGDAAAIAGADMSEMGAILNKVKTANKAYNGELQQLSDRGLPVYQWIAKEANISADSVAEFASKGKVSSEMLMKAIEKNIGGAAKKMGNESFTAGLANMWSAVGRLGASFLDAGGKGGGFFSQMKPLIVDFTGRIDDLGGIAESAGKKLGGMLSGFIGKVKSVKKTYEGLSPEVQEIIKKVAAAVAAITVSIGPVLTVLGMFGGFVGKIATGLGTLLTGFAKFGGVAKILGSIFAALTSPIGLVVLGITALTTGIVLAYQKSETFRDVIHGIKDAFLNAVKGIKEFFTTNETVLAIVEQLKKNFEVTKKVVSSAIDVIAGFFKEKISEMKKFWDENGEQIFQAFKNIFTAIKTVTVPVFKLIGSVIQSTLSVILTVIKAALPYIKTIFSVTFKVVLSIIKSVWSNIEGIISGALKVITGTLKIFAGLFTGDFKKMWSGIKDVFFGALQTIWNYVELMLWGKMLKGILALGKLLVGGFRSAWTSIYNVVNELVKRVVDFVRNGFTSLGGKLTGILDSIRSVIVGAFTKSRDFVFGIVDRIFIKVGQVWTSIFTKTGEIFGKVFGAIRDAFTKMRDSVANGLKFIWDKIRDTWTTILSRTKERFSAIFGAIRDAFGNVRKTVSDGVSHVWTKVRDTWNNLKTKTAEIFSDIYQGIKGKFNDIVQAAKDLPGRIGAGIKKFASKVGSGITELKDIMIGKLKGALNGVIGGINWVLDLIHVPNIPTWDGKSVPKKAQGTDNHPGGPVILGDGRGDNAGPELVTLPGGKSFLSAPKDTLYPYLPKGTSVLSAKKTRNLFEGVPQYAKGKGWLEKTTDFLKKPFEILGKEQVRQSEVQEQMVADVWDKSGKWLLNKALGVLKIGRPSNKTFADRMAGGGWDKVKPGGAKYIEKKRDAELLSGGPAPKITGSGVAWTGTIKKAAAAMGEQLSTYELHGIVAQIQRESTGNQRIVQSPLVRDINTATGNPARGLLQYIPQTFNRYKMKGHGDIYNGYDQLLAFFNNRNWRRDLPYGRRGWGPTGSRKFASGGKVWNGLYQLGEEGWPEWIIPTAPSRRTEAAKLLALAGKDISKNKRPYQLPNPGGQDNGGQDNGRLEKMVELLNEQVMLLQQLVVKDQNVYLDGKQMARPMEKHITELQRQNQVNAMRARGLPT